MIYSTLSLLLKDPVARIGAAAKIGSNLHTKPDLILAAIRETSVDLFVCGLYVALVESAFRQKALSSTGAKGFFQMTDTAVKEVGAYVDVRDLDYVSQYLKWAKYARQMNYVIKEKAIEWAEICNYKPANRSKFVNEGVVSAVYSNTEPYFPYELDFDHDGIVTSADYARVMYLRSAETWIGVYTITTNFIPKNSDWKAKVYDNKGIINKRKLESERVHKGQADNVSRDKNSTLRESHERQYERTSYEQDVHWSYNVREIDLNGW